MMDAAAVVVVSNCIILPAMETCFKRLPLAAVRSGHWRQQSFGDGILDITVSANELL
jgi:hypothetical protein